jgi:L-fuculose-phosphate aldolase
MNRLRFTHIATERDLRLAIVEAGCIAYERGLMSSNDGNISARLAENLVIITPSGLCKGRMDLEDLIIVDMEGTLVWSNSRRRLRPSFETSLHLTAYKQRPDIRSVIHAHPIYATALTIADIPFPEDVLPEVLLTLGSVPTTPYATPTSHEDTDAVRRLIVDNDAILLRQHGSLTVGKNLDIALIHLERIEKVAQTYFYAKMMGKVNRIPPEAIIKLLKVREKNQKGG